MKVMDIIKPPDLLPLLKEKHILLDTNILIDSLIKPTVFTNFIKELKDNGTIITSIDPVAYEFLQGAATPEKFKEKQELLNGIIDAYLPITKPTFENIYTLIELFGIEGKGTDMTDLILGGVLMQYPERLFLFTKNTTDFPMNIYTFKSVFNFPHNKSIQTYGVYTYKKG